jgi:ribose transport system ATP-binding protein
LIRLIVGRILPKKFPEKPYKQGAQLLRVVNLGKDKKIDEISFTLHRGEILGISGLIGAGGTALTRAIFGADPANEGEIYLESQRIQVTSPKVAISHGIGLLTDDRLEQGLIPDMLAQDNVTLAALEDAWPGPLIDPHLDSSLAAHYAERLGITKESLLQQTLFLSGGTQQKIVLAKWLATQARVLIFDEPTRGIDIGSRVEIYNLINDLAQNGNGIIITSVDLNEILGMSDRILVLRKGRLVADVPRARATKQNLLAYASGRKPV